MISQHLSFSRWNAKDAKEIMLEYLKMDYALDAIKKLSELGEKI